MKTFTVSEIRRRAAQFVEALGAGTPLRVTRRGRVLYTSGTHFVVARRQVDRDSVRRAARAIRRAMPKPRKGFSVRNEVEAVRYRFGR